MDRRIAEKLHDALFSPCSSYSQFQTDWQQQQCHYVPPVKKFSPFNYDPLSLETYPLIWTEDMVTHIMAQSYSPSILGKVAKAPMAAIVLDIIDLVTFLRSISSTTEPKPVAAWLTEFLHSHRLRSINTESLDVNWAVSGYLADMFTIVTCFANIYNDWLRCSLREPFNGAFSTKLTRQG